MALVVISTIQLFVAVKFWWARSRFFFFIPIGVWLAYRMSLQFVVEEVPAPEEELRKIG